MEHRETRKEKAAATKKKIFETAITLIKQKGYENVTVSEVCKAAQVAKGSFYVHYKSKEDIVNDSYYTDMGEYITSRYQEFIRTTPNVNSIDRIKFFLNSEFEFAAHAGFELTCLAYSLNLSSCTPGPSEHFSKRNFTNILYNEIKSSKEHQSTPLSTKEVFDFFESIVRGVMATWCFSNNSFDIVSQGKKYIDCALSSIFKASEDDKI